MEETLNNNDQNNYLIAIVIVSTKSNVYTQMNIMGTADMLMRHIRGRFPRGLEGQVGATWDKDSVERTAVQRP